MIKVKVSRKYKFLERNKKLCVVKLFLPMEGGYLIPELRDESVEVFGQKLHRNWGFGGEEGFAFNTQEYVASTWKDLEKMVDDLVTESIELIQKVYTTNCEDMEKIPSDKEETYVIK